MKTSYNIQFLVTFCVLLLIAAIIPQQDFAQRFSHPSSGGARATMPVSRPPAMVQAPARRSEAPVRQQAPVAQQPRQSINGGTRNFGNHDLNRNTNADVHNNVTIHDNANIHNNANIHSPRENVNVYHTGSYRGLHPYSYHPYQPFYWGPRWHPIGFFLSSLAANALRISIANQYYYYDDGCYYIPYRGGYSVVPPPIGAVVSYLPDGYETVMLGNDTYYYYGGAFYINVADGYQVVQAPIGAVVSQLPVGAVEQDVNGETFLVYNNTYYQPISQDGQDAYEVVQGN